MLPVGSEKCSGLEVISENCMGLKGYEYVALLGFSRYVLCLFLSHTFSLPYPARITYCTNELLVIGLRSVETFTERKKFQLVF